MEPLGWIHTQASELGHLSGIDAKMHGKMLESRPDWDIETSVIGTCSFTQGSCSLSMYNLTPEGIEWSKQAPTEQDTFDSSCWERSQIILSSKFLGFFMVPANGGLWNYNFNGINFSETMRYSLVVDNPREFYSEMHRTQHFLDFTARTGGEEDEQVADRDDHF